MQLILIPCHVRYLFLSLTHLWFQLLKFRYWCSPFHSQNLHTREIFQIAKSCVWKAQMTNLEARHFAGAVLRQNSDSVPGRAMEQKSHPVQSISTFPLLQGQGVNITLENVLPINHHHKLYFSFVPGLLSKHSGIFSLQLCLSMGRLEYSHPADLLHDFQVIHRLVQLGFLNLRKFIRVW